MEVVRILNPKSLGFIKDFLIPGEGFATAEQMEEHLANLLLSYPKNSYFSVALEAEENRIDFFILAFAQPNSDLCVLIQTWAREGVKPFFVNKMFELFFSWCEAGGFERIRAETTRNPPQLFQKRGFSPLYQVLEKNLLKESEDASSPSSSILHIDEPTATVDESTSEERPDSGEADSAGPLGDNSIHK
jgi:hypothetical protein